MRKLVRKIKLNFKRSSVSSEWLVPSNYNGQRGVILAHGAGNDMHSHFIRYFHHALAQAGILSVKFNFLYKEKGGKAPDKTQVLQQTFMAVLNRVQTDALAPKKLVIGGKSMGARIASMVAAELQSGVAGLLFLGYPLHPPKQFEKIPQRTEHLPKIKCPMLFLQGTRDNLCDLTKLRPILKSLKSAQLDIIVDGDHSFKVLKRTGKSEDEVFAQMLAAILRWYQKLK